MTFLINLISNIPINNDLVFYSVFTGVTSVIGWSFFTSYATRNILGSVQTVSKETMTSPVTDLTVTPRTFSFTRNQLRNIENHVDSATQTDPSLDALFTPISEKGVQAVSNLTEKAIQVNPPLSVDIPALDNITIFRNINMSDLGSVFFSNTSGSIQAVPEVKSAGVQTLFDNVSQGTQTIINSDLAKRADLVEFGTSPINRELTDRSVQTLFNKLEQSIQTMSNPDLIIHGTSPSIGKFVDPLISSDVINQADTIIQSNEVIAMVSSLLSG